MHVWQLPVPGKWKIYAACTARGDCQLQAFLDDLGAQFQSSVDGFYALLAHVAQEGPPRNTNLCHQLRNDIWEFRKGRIRVLYFCHEGKVIVCTHGLMKASRKIGNADIERAEAVLRDYRSAVADGTLEEENENGE